MEELLASQTKKLISLFRGQSIEGEVVLITDKDIILDLGAKSEGVFPRRELLDSQLNDLKMGDKLKAYVLMPENEHGQVVLSLQRSLDFARDKQARLRGGKSRGGKFIDWSKFVQAQNQKSKLQGRVLEVNKGGLIVEVEGIRGFLPNSQVGFELLSKAGQGPLRRIEASPLRQSASEVSLEGLIGQDLTVTVIETDQPNNKLIFSQRGQVSDDVKKRLKDFKIGQKASGKIVAILPFGLVVSVKDRSASGGDVEGLVFISDVSWERQDDLSKLFKVEDEIEVMVIGIDEELGRLNLSIKQLSEDPFGKLAQKYPADEVVKGEITAVSDAGAAVKLEDPSGELGTSGLEGFLPASKMDQDTIYEVGKSITLLVDSVDSKRRRINLAPFRTSTAGLIYK